MAMHRFDNCIPQRFFWIIFVGLISYCFLLADGVGHRQRKEARLQLSDREQCTAGEEDVASRPSGHKQRKLAKQNEGVDSSGSEALPFNQDLKLDWADGSLTTEEVQRYAMHAAQQGASGLAQIARMGNWGQHTQNLMRAFRNFLGKPAGAPEFSWFDIPYKDGLRPHPFLLPHAFFSAFYAEKPIQD